MSIDTPDNGGRVDDTVPPGTLSQSLVAFSRTLVDVPLSAMTGDHVVARYVRDVYHSNINLHANDQGPLVGPLNIEVNVLELGLRKKTT